MFDFEKLEVYGHLRDLNKKLFSQVLALGIDDAYLIGQLKQAQLGILLNLSEGTARMTKSEKKRYYTLARSSIYKVVTILQVLIDLDKITVALYQDLYLDCERGSKMLLGMVRSMNE